MKTSITCLALLAATAVLIIIDRQFPHVLSPQTYTLLLLTCGISLFIHASRLKRTSKYRHPHTG